MKTFQKFLREQYEKEQEEVCECERETFAEWKEEADMDTLIWGYSRDCYFEGYDDAMSNSYQGERTVKFYEPDEEVHLGAADQISWVMDKGKIVKLKVVTPVGSDPKKIATVKNPQIFIGTNAQTPKK